MRLEEAVQAVDERLVHATQSVEEAALDDRRRILVGLVVLDKGHSVKHRERLL